MGEKAYKGFGKGLVCRGKQYTENTVFEEPEAVVCIRGMHYCKNPFDVLDHYNLVNNDGSFNDFAEVEPLAEEKTDDGKKFCTTKLRIGAKLSFSGFIKACVGFVIEKTKFNTSEGDNAEDSAQIGSSGYSAQIGSSGYSAQIGSSGNSAQIDSTGMHAVIMCAGHDCTAKAKIGSFITLAEWEYSDEFERYIPVNVVTQKVDGKVIKEDTFYKLKDGKFVEVGG